MADTNWSGHGPLAFPISISQQILNTWRAPSMQLATSILGTGVLTLGILRSVRYVWTNLLRPGRLHIFQHSQSGSWALVTGASDGIGLAFVEELLARGFHVLMHGRNESKLSKARDQLAAKYPDRTVRIVVADASSLDRPEQIVVDAVGKIPGQLTVLINNVGGQDLGAPFVPVSEIAGEEVDRLLNLNIRFGTQLTRLLLPKLQANSPALVLNSGSIAGVVGMGYISIYSAAKGFVHTLTRALRMEAHGEKSDVEVTTALIGNTISNSNTTDVPIATISARDCARGCLDQVGNGEAFIYPSWRHSFPLAVMNLMPEGTRVDLTINEMKGRNQGLAKEK